MIVENKNQLKASAEFTQTIISVLASGRGVHAETAISAAARMAGTFVLRSSGLPFSNFEPGTPIFSDVIDEAGQKVLQTVGDSLSVMNVILDADKLDYNLPEENNPRMQLSETQTLLDAPFRKIMDKYRLTEEEGAHAAAVSTAVLIQKCLGVLDPHLGYTVAAFGMIEACKTVPFDARQPA
jgi:hypothetical protein